MTDKDIGRIWASLANECYEGESCINHRDEWLLLRSLVMERAKRHCHGYIENVDNWEACLNMALMDFGIDKESWRKINGEREINKHGR